MKKPVPVLFVFFLFLVNNHLSSQNVNVTGAVVGNGSYATLTAAFSAINGGAQPSANIIINVVGNTNEPATGGTLDEGTWTTLLIKPSGGNFTISGAVNPGLPLLNLNGADRVTIDGLKTGGNSLTIVNTTLSTVSGTSTIRFINGACNNIITNTSVIGSYSGSATTAGGNIYFSTDAITANGNDNNTISACDISNGSSLISSFGSTSTSALFNSGNIASGNNIFNYQGPTVVAAIMLSAGTADFTIQNNKFYLTNITSYDDVHSSIRSNSSNVSNLIITGNTIGYSSSAGTGSYVVTSISGSGRLIPIYITAAGTVNIQNNILTNMRASGNNTGSIDPIFAGIYVINGNGTISNNTIGSSTVTNAIQITPQNVNFMDMYGMYILSFSGSVTNNIIGGFSGSTLSGTGVRMFGMLANSPTIQNNTILNLNNPANHFYSRLVGINCFSSSTITGNTVRNLTYIGQCNTTGSTAGVTGIYSGGGTLSQNTVHSFSVNTTAGVQVNGMVMSGNATISRNSVHSISSNDLTGSVNGLLLTGGTVTVNNNMIRLGYDAAGGSITAGIPLYGIQENGGITNLYFNSVYVGGTGVTGSNPSFAFKSTVTGATRNYQNNIFYNARSNGSGTGKHYSISVGGTAPNPAGLTSNYNDLFVTGTGGIIGSFNSVDQTNISLWRSATGQDTNSICGDPFFINATGTASTVDLHISSTPTPIEQTGLNIGTVTDDFDGQTRSSFSPTDIGADAGDFPILTCTTADAGIINITTDTLCAGQSTVLTSVGATAGFGILHQWKVSATPGGPYINVSGGSGGNSISYTTGSLSPGNYYYVLETTCSLGPVSDLSNEMHLQVLNLPTVSGNSAPSSSICSGSQATFTGSGANTYTWSGGAVNGVSFTPPASATYTVTGTDIYGCSNTATLAIVVNNLPSIGSIVAPNDTVCSGSTITLSGTGANSYSWTGGISDNAPFSIPASNTYTVTGTDLNNCSSTSSITITTLSLPVVGSNATPGSAVCIGDTLTLNGTGAVSYSWSNGVINGIPFAPGFSNTYTVTGTGANGCTNTNTHSITVYSLPSVSSIVSPSSTVCSGTPVTISGNGANTYSWTGGIINNISFIPLTTTTYTVTGTDVNGCSNTNTRTITVNSLPAVSLTVVPSLIVCAGSPVTMSGENANTYTCTGGVTDGVPFTPTSTTTYTVTGTDGNNCSNTASVTITVNPLPIVSYIALSNDSVCIGDSVTLFGSGANSYSWSGGITDGTAFLPAGSNSYILTGTDNNGCVDTAMAFITVNPLPLIGYSASPNDTVCPGGTIALNGTGGLLYSWSGGITDGNPFNVFTANNYMVTGTDGFGCTNTFTAFIGTWPMPVVDLGADLVLPSPPAVLDAGAGFATYLWTTSATTQTISVNTNGEYIVSVTNDHGCSDSDTIQVNFTSGLMNENGSSVTLAIYPNPAIGLLHVNIQHIETQELCLKVTNLIGQEVFSKNLGPVKETIVEQIDLSDLTAGTYFISAIANGRTIKLKFIIW